MFRAPQQGDMLMDAPATDSWRELCAYACDREYWKTRVRSMWQPRITTVNIGSHIEDGRTAPFTVSTWVLSCRFRLRHKLEWNWGMWVCDKAQHLQCNISTQMSLRSYVNHADLTLQMLCLVTHSHSSVSFKFMSPASTSDQNCRTITTLLCWLQTVQHRIFYLFFTRQK